MERIIFHIRARGKAFGDVDDGFLVGMGLTDCLDCGSKHLGVAGQRKVWLRTGSATMSGLWPGRAPGLALQNWVPVPLSKQTCS